MKTVRAAIAAGLGLVALSATPVLAATVNGFVTANVNERSGPSTQYPPIVVIPAGSPIIIYGCLSDDSWCDISWGPNRGWMSSAYLQVNYQARRIPLRSYSNVPFITFNFGNYWDSHYKNRSFFKQRSKWSNFHWQGNNQGQNQNQGSNNNPKPPKFPDHKPPKFPGNNNGSDNNNGNNGSGYGNGSNGNGNGQGMGNNSNNGKYGKNCKRIDGKWVCK